MAGLIEQVTEEAEAHGLKLLGKPYVGFVVYGSEIHIRNYLYELIKEIDIDQNRSSASVSGKADRDCSGLCGEWS